MSLTRRTFLSRGSIGVAIAGGLALHVPALLARLPVVSSVIKAQPAATAKPLPAGLTEPLIAHVRNATSGEISLLVGTNKVVIHDLDLAARLFAAARR